MKKIPLLLIVLFCNCSLLFAQNFVSVKKPGRLSKEMSKADISSGVTKLQIEGVLNSEDLSYLSSLSSLETLDLTKVYFTQENSRHPFAQTKIYLSGFPSLLNLLLPEYQNDFCIEITNQALPKLAYLKMPSNASLITTYPTGRCYFQKLELTGEVIKTWDEDEKETQMIADTLIIPELKSLSCSAARYILPLKIISQKENKRILNRWSDSFSTSLLEHIDSISVGAFWKSEIETITIPSNIKVIPNLCFYECKKLKEINLGQIEEIGQLAFAETALEKITIPASITEIGDRAFNNSQIKQIVFQGQNAPQLYYINQYNKKDYNYDATHLYYNGGGADLSYWKSSDIFIPKGSRSNFSIGIWKEIALKEEGEQSEYNLTVEKAGTLANLLTDNIKSTATSLILTGFLYDTDLKCFEECTHLRLLDLSRTFISISPETLKDQQAERQFLANYLSFIADAAKQQSKDQYNQGNSNLVKHIGEQMEAMTLKELATTLSFEKVEVDSRCWIPSNAFYKLNNLQELRLPLQLASVPGIWNKSVKTIVLPPSLKNIQRYAFSGCESLQTINIPSTVNYIGEGAFKDCKSLKSLDLSNTSVENIFSETFKGTDALYEIRFPATLKSMRSVFSQSDLINKKERVKLYFKTREIPQYFVVDSKIELHIPKGSRAGWQKSNYTKHIIEE